MSFETKKILVVGAGGIGCELLKNLAVCGSRQIFVVDLDTIEYSNLNRQFLFQREHVGKPKAQVAADSISRFAPDLKVEWRHKSIMEPEFDVNFFKQFDFVLNALDNRAARNHVNRMCLAADVHLIESGSSGYLGQTTVIKKGQTECYECQPKAPPKNFPACTIRNTPSEPIHCIVWAKHLFNQLFGQVDPDEDVSPDFNDAEAQDSTATTADEPHTNGGAFVDTKCKGNGTTAFSNGIINNAEHGHDSSSRTSTRKWAIEQNYDPVLLFNKLYFDDITYLLSMTNLWKKRIPPKPFTVNNVDTYETSDNDQSPGMVNCLEEQKVWSLRKCADTFLDCVLRLKSPDTSRVLIWDKDDDLAMDFVVSCANIRSTVFNIPRKSRFDIKSMAGNIVPAIATTNAIVAGLIVKEVMNLCSERFQECATTYLLKRPNFKGNYFAKCDLFPPNPKCYVCSDKAEVHVKLNVNHFSIKSLEEKILKQTLNMVAPDVEIDDNKGTIIISSEKDEISGLDEKTLAELNIGDGTRLNCDDFKQQFELRLIVVNCPETSGDSYEIVNDVSLLKPMAEEPTTSKQADELEDDICCIEHENPVVVNKMDTSSNKKRKADMSELEIESPKRTRN